MFKRKEFKNKILRGLGVGTLLLSTSYCTFANSFIKELSNKVDSNQQYITHNSIKSLKLSDVLDAAIVQQELYQKIQKNSLTNMSSPTKFKLNKSSTWLASSPSVVVNYLKSDRQLGTDELEMAINLPIKSTFQASIDDALVTSSQRLNHLFLSNLRLQLSGLIREHIWDIEIAKMQLNTLQQKSDFLEKLQQQYQQLFQSGVVTQYPLLLIKQEMLGSKIEQLSLKQQIKTTLSQYHTVTGLSVLPKNIHEQFTIENINITELITQHPLFKKLQHHWFEQLQRLKLASNKAEPWKISLMAKNLDNSNYQETQIGIGAEVALTLFDTEKQGLNNEWKEAKVNYDLARSQLYLKLKRNLQKVLNQQDTLVQKQQLLEKSKALSKDIIKETQLLINANQIDQSQAIRRMLAAFTTKTHFQLNQLLLQKNIAILKQASGISL